MASRSVNLGQVCLSERYRRPFSRWAVLAVAVFGWCGACSMSPQRADSERLVLTGSSTLAPLVAEIGKRFEQRHPGVRVDVQSGGSSRGIVDVRRGLADLGMVSRALGPEEQDLIALPIARDGIGLIVHRDNPVEGLSDEAVVAIFTGEIDNWKAVGGVDAPIVVVNKAEGRSTLALFLECFGLQNRDVQADVVIGDNEQGIKTVAGNPAAIGYVSIGSAQHDADAGVAIRLLPLRGVAATTDAVRSGEFSLSRPLNLVARAAPQGLAAAFVAFAGSPEGQAIVQEQAFVPLQP